MNTYPEYRIEKRLIYNDKDIYRYEIVVEYIKDETLRENCIIIFEHKDNFLKFRDCINSLDVDNW